MHWIICAVGHLHVMHAYHMRQSSQGKTVEGQVRLFLSGKISLDRATEQLAYIIGRDAAHMVLSSAIKARDILNAKANNGVG